MRPTVIRILLLIAVLAPPASVLFHTPEASACPFCETEIGKQVEAGIFDSDFAENVVLTLLPFPILLGIVALIHFGLPRTPGTDQQNPPTQSEDFHARTPGTEDRS